MCSALLSLRQLAHQLSGHLMGTALLIASVGLALPAEAQAESKPTKQELSARDLVQQAIAPQTVHARLSRYVPVDLGVEENAIPADLRGMLGPLRQAADILDGVYWSQMSSDGKAMYESLRKSTAGAATMLADLLSIHYGVWDRHANDEPIIGDRRRPDGANFYPADMARRELVAWTGQHPESADVLASPYTVVQREGNKLKAVPYSKAYESDLQAAATALRSAADAYECRSTESDAADCPCDGLVDFFRARAESLLDDDYQKSEVLWMQTGLCPLDAVIGPYEFYEDRLLAQKTAFEAIIYLRDDKASKKYQGMQSQMDGLLANIPVTDALRSRLQVMEASPITIADVLYTAGEARSGYQIRAFMLPNDEEVRRNFGAKHVILRNVARAKFDRTTKPIANQILTPAQAKEVSFEEHFNFLVTWQLAFLTLPRPLEMPGGKTINPRQRLGERQMIIEGAKAEALALLNYLYLADRGVLDSKSGTAMTATYLATLFESARLAPSAPQAVVRTIVYNYLANEWVFRYNPGQRRFEVNPTHLRKAVGKLAAETLEILARGDYDGAGRMIVQYGIMSGEMRDKLEELSGSAVGIIPTYISMPSGQDS